MPGGGWIEFAGRSSTEGEAMGRSAHTRRSRHVRRGLSRPRRPGVVITLVLAMGLLGIALAAQAGAVAAAPTISINDVSTPEGGPGEENHFVSVPVTLSEASPVAVSVSWQTVEGTASAADPSDADDDDFFGGSGLVFFAPGETAKTIDILIDGGGNPEADETFTVELFAPTNATIARGVATVTIVNDDVPPPPEPGEVNLIPS